jgi:CRP-like cAMP-binding protein
MRNTSLAMLQTSGLFGGLDEQALIAVLDAAQTRRHARGTRLVTQDVRADSVHFLLSGALKLTTTDGETTITLGFIRPGASIGEQSVLARMPYVFTAKTTAQSETLVWPAARFEGLTGDFPQIVTNCIALAIARECQMLRRMRAGSENVEKRIARALAELAATETGWQESGIVIPASGRDIAQLSNTTVYTVSRVLSRWKRRELLAGGRGNFQILDAPRLQQIIDGMD